MSTQKNNNLSPDEWRRLRLSKQNGEVTEEFITYESRLANLHKIIEQLKEENAGLEKESEARAEVIKRLTDAGTKRCPDCDGQGVKHYSGNTLDRCERCKGRGVVSVVNELSAQLTQERSKVAHEIFQFFASNAASVLFDGKEYHEQPTLEKIDVFGGVARKELCNRYRIPVSILEREKAKYGIKD